MTTRKLTRRGRSTVLPIVGDTVVEVRLSTRTMPALVFLASDWTEAELAIEDRITLGRGGEERVLEGSKPGVTFDPNSLAPLVELLGCEVTEAVAEWDGRLRIEFSNKQTLRIDPSHGYEAWHFRHPRPGRPSGGASESALSVTGAHGRLI